VTPAPECPACRHGMRRLYAQRPRPRRGWEPVTWECTTCGQVGQDLQAPLPAVAPEPEPAPVPEPEPLSAVLLESLVTAWTGETRAERQASSAGVSSDFLDGIDAAADAVARETRAPRKGDR